MKKTNLLIVLAKEDKELLEELRYVRAEARRIAKEESANEDYLRARLGKSRICGNRRYDDDD